MNKKILSISALSGVAILGLIMALAPTSDVTTFEVNENFSETLGKYSENRGMFRSPPDLPLSLRYADQVENIDQIRGMDQRNSVATTSQLTAVQTQTPNLTPQGFELKAVFYETQDDGFGDMVSQFYMPNSADFTSDTTFGDVMDNGGFVVIQVNEDPEKITKKWPKKLGDITPEFTKVGDSKAMVVSGDGTIGHDTQIFFYNENTFVNLVSVSLNSDELLKIANSMN